MRHGRNLVFLPLIAAFLGGCWIFGSLPELAAAPTPDSVVLRIKPGTAETMFVYVVPEGEYPRVSDCRRESGCPQLSEYPKVTLTGSAEEVTVGSGQHYLLVVCSGRIVLKRPISPSAGRPNEYNVYC